MQEVITGILINVAVGVIGLGGAFATKLLRKATVKLEAETLKIQDERKRNFARDALENLHVIAAKTVTKIEQTTAAALREAVKDGKVDRKELLVLADQAYFNIVEILKPQYIEVLQNEFGNINEYIKALIEEKVHEIKTSRIQII